MAFADYCQFDPILIESGKNLGICWVFLALKSSFSKQQIGKKYTPAYLIGKFFLSIILTVIEFYHKLLCKTNQI